MSVNIPVRVMFYLSRFSFYSVSNTLIRFEFSKSYQNDKDALRLYNYYIINTSLLEGNPFRIKKIKKNAERS